MGSTPKRVHSLAEEPELLSYMITNTIAQCLAYSSSTRVCAQWLFVAYDYKGQKQ